MHNHKANLIKGEAPLKLVAFFIRKIERRETPKWDPLGIETLGFLVEAVSIFETKSQACGAIAKYVLEKANDKVRFRFYTSTLRTLSTHVSAEVAEQLVAHLVAYGEVNTVIDITVNKLQRSPSRIEVSQMIEYHRKGQTSSAGSAWKALIALADDETKLAIENILCELRVIESDFIIT